MHRSGSSSRVAKDFFTQSTSSSSPLPQPTSHNSKPSSEDLADYRLPIYDPLSAASKKESSDLRSAELAVHLIPIVLLLCALMLWLFSNTNPEFRP